MKILGLVKTSTVDYPGKLVSTIFLGGCNLNCEYCHNQELISPGKNIKEISQKEVLKHLKNRKDIIEGLCISGGEATIHEDVLVKFVKEVKEHMGKDFVVKLDTNGTNPDFLERYLELFDFIAMDYKTLDYEKHLNASGENVEKSLEILKKNHIDYEIRVTVYPPYIKIADFIELANALKGVKKVAIQQYQPVEQGAQDTYSPNVLYELKRLLNDNGIECELKC